eukprot:Blabericola_migrator_1__1428@NODE_1375_length_4692_cov_853_442378_g922_i0_p1_GENE_NODE_1375_length_4692_cov_853_442378_g922_i0NODE_1375_length_4692_cov_853_442378_g922_i0_p1_ORF_typecomplete_len826_score178_81_NODE_1375_length_4692_cov_853_442378_g922_i010873564
MRTFLNQVKACTGPGQCKEQTTQFVDHYMPAPVSVTLGPYQLSLQRKGLGDDDLSETCDGVSTRVPTSDAPTRKLPLDDYEEEETAFIIKVDTLKEEGEDEIPNEFNDVKDPIIKPKKPRRKLFLSKLAAINLLRSDAASSITMAPTPRQSPHKTVRVEAVQITSPDISPCVYKPTMYRQTPPPLGFRWPQRVMPKTSGDHRVCESRVVESCEPTVCESSGNTISEWVKEVAARELHDDAPKTPTVADLNKLLRVIKTPVRGWKEEPFKSFKSFSSSFHEPFSGVSLPAESDGVSSGDQSPVRGQCDASCEAQSESQSDHHTSHRDPKPDHQVSDTYTATEVNQPDPHTDQPISETQAVLDTPIASRTPTPSLRLSLQTVRESSQKRHLSEEKHTNRHSMAFSARLTCNTLGGFGSARRAFGAPARPASSSGARILEVLPGKMDPPTWEWQFVNAPDSARFKQKTDGFIVEDNALKATRTFLKSEIIAVIHPSFLYSGSEKSAILTLSGRVADFTNKPGFPQWTDSNASFGDRHLLKVQEGDNTEGLVLGLYPYTYWLMPPTSPFWNVYCKFHQDQLALVAAKQIDSGAELRAAPPVLRPIKPAMTSEFAATRADFNHFSANSELERSVLLKTPKTQPVREPLASPGPHTLQAFPQLFTNGVDKSGVSGVDKSGVSGVDKGGVGGVDKSGEGGSSTKTCREGLVVASPTFQLTDYLSPQEITDLNNIRQLSDKTYDSDVLQATLTLKSWIGSLVVATPELIEQHGRRIPQKVLVTLSEAKGKKYTPVLVCVVRLMDKWVHLFKTLDVKMESVPIYKKVIDMYKSF